MTKRHESPDVLRGTIDLLILRTVATQPMHGWGISQAIRSVSKGVLDVNQGSLYPALQRLEQRDWIDGEWRTTENNRRARYYRITAKGRRVIGQEIDSWRQFASAVELVLRAAPSACLLWMASVHGADAQPAMAQPSSPSAIAARGLPVRSDTLDFIAGDREHGQFQGYYAYSVARAPVGGRPGYLVSMNHRSPGSGNHFQSDTLAVDSATLSPAWHRYHAWDDSAVVAFTGRHATGWSLRNGHRAKVDFTLPDAAFDRTLVRWILPALPLGPSYQGSLTTFDIWTNKVETAVLRVSGSEVVQFGSRRVDAWVLEAASGYRRWVAKESGGIVREYDASGGGGIGFWMIKR
ncbi:MAG TPA: PadR family transcriptional regulator [Gemmatimonadaceae bacterium]|nr:PadR family transcriptional regulator [Gemmatimonadaceae bacterium]